MSFFVFALLFFFLFFFLLLRDNGGEGSGGVNLCLVLGLNDTTAARRLVRLLLSDPLAPKEGWEDVLKGSDADISQGLVIRYAVLRLATAGGC